MVLKKESDFEKSFGRWVGENEIIIEDLTESEIMNVAEKMAKVGYSLEYWKSPKQISGHLHVKDIKFPEEPKLTNEQKRLYKKKIMEKYVPTILHKNLDWNFVDSKRHRIAEENKEHYKGYGIKSLVKEWNKGEENWAEQEIFEFSSSDETKKHMVKCSVEDYQDIIEKIIPKWIQGNRQNLALYLSGFLRKNRKLGSETIKAILTEICNKTGDKELTKRLSAVDDTFKKNEKEVKGVTGLGDLQLDASVEKEENDYRCQKIEAWTFKDFKELKKDKNFLINHVLYPKTVNMVYSPPAQFKSLMCLDMALCLSNSLDWMGNEVKKRKKVLYCDKENNDQLIKERLLGLHKGHGLTRGDFPLHILRRNGDLLNNEFILALHKFVEENEIEVIFFDTLHRFADYDENRSDDLNRLYTMVFQPLIEKYGVSIVFLHHTKKDGGYRGSGDFLGMVDTAWSVRREGKSNKFKIVNEKARSGEIENICGEIDFGVIDEELDYVKILRLNEAKETEVRINKLKAVTNFIKDICKEGKIMKRKDMVDAFEMAELGFITTNDSLTKLISRSLKWLVDNGYLSKEGHGGYTKTLT